jgi:membrane protein YqaA with SNARE-associated domain
MTTQVSRFKKYLAISILALTVIISVGGSILLVQHWEYISMLEKQGYIGLFLISIFAGSPIPIPSPGMILTFTLGSILNPILVGLVAGLGNGIGNALVFWTGRGGFAFFQNLGVSRKSGENHPSWIDRILKKLRMPKMREFARKRALWAVFVLSIYPNPIITPIILGMGAARYNFWKFFFACLAGKIFQSLVLSYLGYFGLRSILRFFGVFTTP